MKALVILTTAAGILMAQAGTPQDKVLRLVKEGHYAEARLAVTRLIEEAARSGAGTSYRAGLFQLLGMAENQLGHYVDAERALKEGVRLGDQNSPVAPQILVSLLVLLAEAHSAQGELKEAGEALRRALTIAEKDLPAGNPSLASALTGLGTLYWQQGLLSRAEIAFRKSLGLLEKRLGPAHPDANVQLGNLAALLVVTGRRAEAVPLLERARKVLEERYGSAHPQTLGVTYSLAVALTPSEPRRAESLLRQVLSHWLVSQPNLHPNTAVFLNALAWTRFEQADVREAIEINERALAISRDVLGDEHAQVVTLMYDRAHLLKAGKRGKEATVLKAQADRIQAARGYAAAGRHSIDVHALAGH